MEVTREEGRLVSLQSRFTRRTECTNGEARPHRHEMKWAPWGGVALTAEGHRHYEVRLSSGWTGAARRVALQ